MLRDRAEGPLLNSLYERPRSITEVVCESGHVSLEKNLGKLSPLEAVYQWPGTKCADSLLRSEKAAIAPNNAGTAL